MTFTITLGDPSRSVRFQTMEQGVALTRRQLNEMDALDTTDCSLTLMRDSGILTGSQVDQARKKLLRQMLSVIGGAQ